MTQCGNGIQAGMPENAAARMTCGKLQDADCVECKRCRCISNILNVAHRKRGRSTRPFVPEGKFAHAGMGEMWNGAVRPYTFCVLTNTELLFSSPINAFDLGSAREMMPILKPVLRLAKSW